MVGCYQAISRLQCIDHYTTVYLEYHKARDTDTFMCFYPKLHIVQFGNISYTADKSDVGYLSTSEHYDHHEQQDNRSEPFINLEYQQEYCLFETS